MNEITEGIFQTTGGVIAITSVEKGVAHVTIAMSTADAKALVVSEYVVITVDTRARRVAVIDSKRTPE